MDRQKREEFKVMVQNALKQGQPDSDIILMLVMHAPLHFSRAGAVKFIKWVKDMP